MQTSALLLVTLAGGRWRQKAAEVKAHNSVDGPMAIGGLVLHAQHPALDHMRTHTHTRSSLYRHTHCPAQDTNAVHARLHNLHRHVPAVFAAAADVTSGQTCQQLNTNRCSAETAYTG